MMPFGVLLDDIDDDDEYIIYEFLNTDAITIYIFGLTSLKIGC
jgi:hypothetical protein